MCNTIAYWLQPGVKRKLVLFYGIAAWHSQTNALKPRLRHRLSYCVRRVVQRAYGMRCRPE